MSSRIFVSTSLIGLPDAAASPAAPAPNRLRLVTSTTAISTEQQSSKGVPQHSRARIKSCRAEPAQRSRGLRVSASYLAYNAAHDAQHKNPVSAVKLRPVKHY